MKVPEDVKSDREANAWLEDETGGEYRSKEADE